MKVLLICLSLVLSSVCAKAADKQVTPIWDGFYIGGSIGYTMGSTTVYVDAANPAFFPDFAGGESMKQSLNSLSGGLELGYNVKSGDLVYGLFGSLVSTGAKDKTWSTGACCGPGDDQFTTSTYGVGILGGRLGYVKDDVMVYVKGGAALALTNFDLTDANIDYLGNATIGSTGHKSTTEILPGFAVGVGVDYALDEHWKLGADYTYINLGSATWDMTTASYSSTGTYSGQATYVLTTRDLSEHMLSASLKYTF
jgi:outer membrane immunogenic protein